MLGTKLALRTSSDYLRSKLTHQAGQSPWSRAAIALTCLALLSSGELNASTVSLTPTRTVTLTKKSGQLDAVVEGKGTALLVRDYSWSQDESKQTLEVYDGGTGRFLRSIGRAGRQPGSYVRLKDVWAANDGSIWIADLIGRVLHFSDQGELLGTRLIENPGYRLAGIAIDENNGVLYLAGCRPLKTYLNHGCSLIHRYSFPEIAHQSSFLETDPLAIERRYLPLEDYDLDLDSSGNLWVIDRPIFKVFRVDPTSGQSTAFALTSSKLVQSPAIPQPSTADENEFRRNESFLLDRVLVIEPWVAVSIRQPKGRGYLLALFDLDGNEVVKDLRSPGRLVGKTKRGELLFHDTTTDGFTIKFYQPTKIGHSKQ